MSQKESDMLRAFRLTQRESILVLAGLVAGLSLATEPAAAAPPWATLVPFKKIDADPNKSYELDEAHGPWMIMAASFAGPNAEKQAQELVLELRQRFKMEAFTFRQTYDFSKPTEGRGWSRYGGPRKMRYMNNYKFDEIAVLVGNYVSVDDPQLDKALEKIKYAKPEILDPAVKKDSSQRFVGLRSLYHMVSVNPEKQNKGPMGAAFVTRNPLLPEELFVAKGLDPFVVEMNKDLTYSLLNCPGRYTVRVASFRGIDTMEPAKFDLLSQKQRQLAKIDEAALNASKLCAALREKGVEAYEFHDRTESIVTVGSFQDVGQPRQDGKTEINPGVHRLMQQYGPLKKAKPGTNLEEVYSRTLAGIPFDPQPMPVEVPKQSIAAAYNPSNSLLR
jgi:hypothetical protein